MLTWEFLNWQKQNYFWASVVLTQYFILQWVPPIKENPKEKDADEQIAIDLGDEYEQALSEATQEEIIDLAGLITFLN